MCCVRVTRRLRVVSECLGCRRCESGPVVTLIDGRVVCNFCEDWRTECEARHVLSMPRIDQRRSYIADVTKRRGEAAGNAFANLIRAVHAHAKAQRDRG